MYSSFHFATVTKMDRFNDVTEKIFAILNEHQFIVYSVSVFTTVISIAAACLYTIARQKTARTLAAVNSKIHEHGEDAAVAKPTAQTEADISQEEIKNRENMSEDSAIDPFEYVQHIQEKVKKAQLAVAEREIEKTMDEEQKRKEREIQRSQLEKIFQLMSEQEDKFGAASFDELKDQMKLYKV